MSVPKTTEYDKATVLTALRLGNLRDPNVPTAPGAVGVPMNVVPHAFYLDAPNAADPDYFVAAHDSTSTGAVTLANTTMQTNAATGRPFARNIQVVMTGAVNPEAVITVTGKDSMGRTRTEELTTSDDTPVEGAIAFSEVSSITVDTASVGSETMAIGFADVFGLPYPCFSGITLGVKADALGDDWPSSTDSGSITAGVADSATADYNGTVTFQDAPDATVKFVVAYLADYPFALDNENGDYPAGSWPSTNT